MCCYYWLVQGGNVTNDADVTVALVTGATSGDFYKDVLLSSRKSCYPEFLPALLQKWGISTKSTRHWNRQTNGHGAPSSRLNIRKDGLQKIL
jgi:hypothetical protein